MKKIIFVIAILLPVIGYSQQKEIKKQRRFQPFITLNYNLQNINYISDYSSYYFPTYRNSNFFGAEFGFLLLPKNENGLFFEYTNKLDAELGIMGIYSLDGNDKGNNIVNQTITSGFFGTLNVGKTIFKNEYSSFITGVSIGDKYASGISGNYLITPQQYEEYDGFHLTPGIFGKFQTKISNQFSLSLNLTLSQSILNFWAFAENGSDFNFKHPLFLDFSVKLQHQSGVYLFFENNYMIPYGNKQSSFRNSIGIGFQF